MSLTISVVQAEVTVTPVGVVATAVQIDLDVLNRRTTHQIVGGFQSMGLTSICFKRDVKLLRRRVGAAPSTWLMPPPLAGQPPPAPAGRRRPAQEPRSDRVVASGIQMAPSALRPRHSGPLRGPTAKPRPHSVLPCP